MTYLANFKSTRDRTRIGVLSADRPMAQRFARFATRPLLLFFGAAVGICLVAGPVVGTVVRSVLAPRLHAAGLTLVNFAALFSNPHFYDAVINTAIAGTGATVLSCLFGFSLSWIVARTDIPGRSWFGILNLVPFFLSPYVGAVSWIYLAAPYSGLLQNVGAQFGLSPNFINIYSIGGVIWVLALFYTPYVYLFLIGPMQSMDAALEDAARVHGARFWYTLRHITIPLLMPALMSGALIVFVTSAGLFDVPLALAAPKGIRMMPTQIYGLLQYPADFGRASAFGVLVMTVTVFFTVLQRRFVSKRRFETITGKGYRPRTVRLRAPGRAAALAFELIYIGSSVGLPLVALIFVSLSPIWTGLPDFSRFTLENYRYVLFDYSLTRTAIANSLILAFSGASIGVVLSVLQAYYLLHGRSRGRGLIDAILSLPLGIPGIILGLGVLILFIRTPLYGTLGIILFAYVARFSPFSTRSVSAMMLTLNPELEQSARGCGATWWQSIRYVTLPLLRPAIAAAWLMLFVVFIRELGSTILLYAQGTETISVALVNLSEQNFGYVAALAVTQTALLLTAFFLFKSTRGSVLRN